MNTSAAVLQPRRAKDNSPAVQRWVCGAGGEQVPSGTKERGVSPCQTISFALRGLDGFVNHDPSDESTGYCRESLRDLWESRYVGYPQSFDVQSQLTLKCAVPL